MRSICFFCKSEPPVTIHASKYETWIFSVISPIAWRIILISISIRRPAKTFLIFQAKISTSETNEQLSIISYGTIFINGIYLSCSFYSFFFFTGDFLHHQMTKIHLFFPYTHLTIFMQIV